MNGTLDDSQEFKTPKSEKKKKKLKVIHMA